MSVTHQSDNQMHTREDGLLTLSLLGSVVAIIFMGWCLFDHERPNMPRATVMEDAGTPR
ncbi:hypothetical protein [Hyphomicrobium sp.]|jgi:hypothetical protein|uniref:hypothetical protein n=1 Tax=Hyphomicrobium sp. TaxID=82 RepID=UPI00356924C9